MRVILFILLVISSFLTFSQNHFRYDQIQVINSAGDTIKNPFGGGFNAPQFSEIDLNFDGIMDLFVFDRDGGIIKTFINGGTTNSVDYTFTADYWSKFPKLRYFALLRDYNCDGKQDIFTGATGGMAVYKNISNPIDGIQFEQIYGPLVDSTLIASDYGSTSLLNLYVPSTDIPAIDDIDGDGDLDVLSFGVWGTLVEFHENLSMDLYGTCDSLTFIANTTCWGNFSENSQNNSVTLGTSCKGVTPFDPDSIYHNLHSGSTLLTIDMDNDGDKELMLGDVSFPNMVELINGGDSITANITAQDSAFPPNTSKVDLYLFPAGYYIDVDNDGVKDLIVAPNAANISENFTSVWLYRNSGGNDSPMFNYVQNDFLQKEMIEIGSGANAVFEDINQDGLLDIIIGNYGYYGNPDFTSSLAYLKNVGTPNNPIFKLIDRDYGGFSAIGVNGLFPTFGDLDADGDNDLILGNYNGDLYRYENIAGNGNPYGFTLFTANYMGIDVGQHSTPQLIDYNGDGLLDLLIGERSGNINYYENKGTPTDPNHSIQSTTLFGAIDVMVPCCTGYSTVHLSKDNNNDFILYVGSEQGIIYIYTDIDTLNPDTSFTLIDSIVTGTKSTSIFTADINNSGKKEEIYGENSGGITILHLNANLNLVAPSNGASNVPYDINLDWEAAPEIAQFYEYFIDTVSTFNSVVFQSGQTNYVSSSSSNIDTEQLLTLSLSQIYFWKVRYLTSVDTSDWSETWSFTVTDDSVTIADFVADFTEVPPMSMVNFTDLSSSNPTAWEWAFSNGTPSTSTAQNPSITYNTEGIFDVQLIAINSFGVDTILKQSYITVEIPAGLFSQNYDGQVKIYPNPAKTSITLEFDYEPINTTVEILDINGKILRHYLTSNKSKYEISILDFSPGVYFINIFNESSSLYFKFIKL